MVGKCLLDPGPSNPPRARERTQHRGPISPTAQNTIPELHSGNFNSPRGTNHSRNAPLLSKATLAFFSPNTLVSRGQRRSGLPLSPWALLLCWWCPELEIHSKPLLLRGEAGLGMKMASGRRPQQSPRSHLRGLTPRRHLSNGFKLNSGTCILESSTLFRK